MTTKTTGRAIKPASKRKTATPRVSVIKERQTRVEVYKAIAEDTGLKRTEVEAVFSSLGRIVNGHMKKQGSGQVSVAGLVKIKRIMRKRTKKRRMVSPLTGTEVEIPAKPARADVKLIPLKALKEMLTG